MRWVVVQVEYNGETIHKLLRGFSGGYLDGSSWELNSGITNVIIDGDDYVVEGNSGSSYRCHKDSEGVCMAMSNIISQPSVTVIPMSDYLTRS